MLRNEAPAQTALTKPKTGVQARLVRSVGRYEVYGEIATGGMATVHIGKLRGAAGFTKIVALKQLHPQYAKDGDFVAMFLDEGRLSSRIQHPNVVSTLDVVAEDNELFIVMEYVVGETLSRLLRGSSPSGSETSTRISIAPETDNDSDNDNDNDDDPTNPRQPKSRPRVPIDIACAIVRDALRGLHAAHNAMDARGRPLEIVHRDVSPQNILVGVDGCARVIDFGIAKAADAAHQTRSGVVKGKVAYMPPEQLYGDKLDRRSDVYSVGVVLWEMLTARRLFAGDDSQTSLAKALEAIVEPPGMFAPEIPEALDDVIMRALEREMTERFSTAAEMADELEKAVAPAGPERVSQWVRQRADKVIEHRVRLKSAIEIEPAQAAVAASRTRWIVAGAALLLAGTVGAVVALRSDASNALREAAPEHNSAPSGNAVSADSRPAATSSLAQPTSAPGTSGAVAADTAANAPSSASVMTPSVAAPVATAGTTSKPIRPQPQPDCNPPYTVDANGHRKYKRECF